jgi:hypothetical protein
MTFFCIATFYKGGDFLRACKAAGNTVYLLTKKKLEHKDWPRQAIDEMFFVESDENTPENLDKILQGFAYAFRSRNIDRIVALDDFDVEKAAHLREHFRIPGMGQTTARYFRDKLAMRLRAQDAGINVPPFSPLFNDETVAAYISEVAPPWVIKPRTEASAIGIRKVHQAEDVWKIIEQLGNNRHNFLIEQFKPGDVYHTDSLTINGKVVFCSTSQYLNTPFEVAHDGGIFRSVTCEHNGADDEALRAHTAEVMTAFGMRCSASHTEFIKSKEDGKFYFLETSARVGGAHLAEMVQFASGVNLWAEWARIEDADAKGNEYHLPSVGKNHAGILVSLSKFKAPDDNGFNDPEVVWRLRKDHHIGMILRSDSRDRILALLNDYAERVHRDFHAKTPMWEKPQDS